MGRLTEREELELLELEELENQQPQQMQAPTIMFDAQKNIGAPQHVPQAQ